MAADKKRSAEPGLVRTPTGKEGVRVLKCAFRERVRRPGTVEADTHSANSAAGDELIFSPEEGCIYWSHKGESKVVPLGNVKDLTIDL